MAPFCRSCVCARSRQWLWMRFVAGVDHLLISCSVGCWLGQMCCCCTWPSVVVSRHRHRVQQLNRGTHQKCIPYHPGYRRCHHRRCLRYHPSTLPCLTWGGSPPMLATLVNSCTHVSGGLPPHVSQFMYPGISSINHAAMLVYRIFIGGWG